MATWYVAPKGTVSGANNGTSAADAWNGINACRAGMGSTSAGDTIVFRGDLGPYGFADQADFAYGGTLSGAFSYSLGTSGCYIGTSSGGPASNASGRIFQFLTGAYGQATIDMHRSDASHTAPQRMYAALMIQGEGMKILNARVIAPNFNYLPGTPGPGSQAEAMSQENYGLRIVGNGNTIDGGEFIGYADTQGFCRAALELDHYVTGTDGLQTIVRNVRTFGAHFGLQCVIQSASATTLRAVIENVTGKFPSWGSTAATGLITGNAGTHGGHLSLSGQWGGLEVRNSTFDGVCQDAIDLITTHGTVRNCTIDNVYAPSVAAWTWNAGNSVWELTTVTGFIGNGIKMGLNGYTGTSPSTWGGSDGTPGGIWNVAEFNNRAIGNKIRNVSMGITTNAGNGMTIHANEITEAYTYAIALNSSTARANFWVSNNYGQLSSSALTSARALTVTANANIILLNNIFDCQKAAGANSTYDLHWLTALTPLLLNKNLYVQGTKVETQPYPGTGDISSVNPGWVLGAGLPVGSALIGAGAHNGYYMDASGVQFWNLPSTGAYEYVRPRQTATARQTRV